MPCLSRRPSSISSCSPRRRRPTGVEAEQRSQIRRLDDLETVEWNNSTLLKGDIAEEVANLKEQPGTEIQVIGSWQLIQTLIKHDLVDEI